MGTTGLGVLVEAHKGHSAIQSSQILLKTHMPNPTHRSAAPSPFLDRCFLCGNRLSHEEDIYMYRGDRAFCSVECRLEQILMDEESVEVAKSCTRASSSSSSPCLTRLLE